MADTAGGGPLPLPQLPLNGMDLAELAGRTFGPRPLVVSPDGVEDFCLATGDDPARWTAAAPPGFVSVALFAMAPELLSLLYDHSVIHGDQSYTWNRALEVGSVLSVSGAVSRSRERRGVYFITFEMEVADRDQVVASGAAGFLAAGDRNAVSSGYERVEPRATDDGFPGEGQLSASRADLVRYAAATRDWNPIHWDHDAAVAAGLPGVIAHGLLQASWAYRLASERVHSQLPLRSAKTRFRRPLFPATPVSPHIVQDGLRVAVSLTDEEAEYVSARIDLSDE